MQAKLRGKKWSFQDFHPKPNLIQCFLYIHPYSMAPILRPLPSFLWWGASAGARPPPNCSSLHRTRCMNTWSSKWWRWAKTIFGEEQDLSQSPCAPFIHVRLNQHDHPNMTQMMLKSFPCSPWSSAQSEDHHGFSWQWHTGKHWIFFWITFFSYLFVYSREPFTWMDVSVTKAERPKGTTTSCEQRVWADHGRGSHPSSSSGIEENSVWMDGMWLPKEPTKKIWSQWPYETFL